MRGYGFKFSGDFWKSAGDLSNGSWTPKKRGRPTKKDKTLKDDETGLMDSQTSLMEQTPPTPTVSLDVKEEGDGEDPTGGVGSPSDALKHDLSQPHPISISHSSVTVPSVSHVHVPNVISPVSVGLHSQLQLPHHHHHHHRLRTSSDSSLLSHASLGGLLGHQHTGIPTIDVLATPSPPPASISHPTRISARSLPRNGDDDTTEVSVKNELSG